MPVNGFTVGKDVAVDIITPAGIVTFSNFTQFESRQMKERRKSHGMDGVSRPLFIPGGWEGTMMYDRQDPTLDRYFAQEEAAYYNGQPISNITITETITETDGTVSVFQYQGVQMMVPNAGRKRGDDKVEQEVQWECSFRVSLT